MDFSEAGSMFEHFQARLSADFSARFGPVLTPFSTPFRLDFWSTFGPFFGLRLFLGYFSLPFFRLVIVREMACFIGFSGFETPVLSPF
jgi:hypothetical protein